MSDEPQHPSEPKPLPLEPQWGLYNDQKKQIWQDIQSGTDSFDQSLLTLSSAALALSLAFIKDIVPLENATWLWVLYVSWICFSACVLVTVASFPVSIVAQNKQLGYLYKYHIERNDEYFNKGSGASKALPWMSATAGALFFIGFVLTLVFCIGNVANSRRRSMCESKSTHLQEGRRPVTMTPTPCERGRQPVSMTPHANPPAQKPATPAPAPKK